MLNRRHIRVKVMQSIYALHQSQSGDLEKEEKFLFYSLESIQDLYLLMISTLTELVKMEEVFLHKSSKKHLVTSEERNPNKKFINNKVIKLLSDSNHINVSLENRKIDNWEIHDDYIQLLLRLIKESDLYNVYMSTRENSFQEDKQFVLDLFTEIIVPNEKLYDYLEDTKMTWIDDIPLVNTEIIKQLKGLKENSEIRMPRLFKDVDDKDFAKNLFRKTVLNEKELAHKYIDKTPNWDTERIAEIDTIILKMAICEFLKFPSIPAKVTINEYLEVAKEYSTPKSSIFINGILDNLVKEFQSNNTLLKTGRGLM